MPSRSFLSRVRAALPDMHPAERRLGELVCEFPGELASYSASELAALAEVSNATVTRFIRRLGYPSYEEARRHAREEGATGSRLYLGHAGRAAADSASAYAEADTENLRRTMATIDMAEIDRLARAMLSARKVWVLGFRAANPLAAYLQWQLIQVIEDIVAVPAAGQTMGEHLVSLRPDDVILVFGLRRRVAQMEVILTSVARAGAQMCYITDEGVARRPGAAWHFQCHTGSPGPLFSHVAVMAVLNLLTNRTVEIAAQEGRDRLRSIESLNDLLGEL
ncbi:MAG: MurR/RpiR family transcriptional regulator [Cypionkella sp.]|jgi:DNA-binding MurR/RpiR family transcriptional regulator